MQEEPGFFPAISLEEGEAVVVNLGQSTFAYPPPEGFKAVIAARKGGVSARQARSKADVGREVEEEDDEEGGARKPIDLEAFSCATDLAERIGPNRLKVGLID